MFQIYFIHLCMKKNIDIDDEDFAWLKEYKRTHGVTSEAFIRSAIKEKIFQTQQELKLRENGTLR